MNTIIGNDINTAADLLSQGQLVAIPTETVYGLAANALNPTAVLRIFEAKQRPHFNPLIVHCCSWEAALKYVSDVPDIAHKLAMYFVPGALTFLLPKKEIIPDVVTAGSALIAIRIPNHPTALSLLKQLPFPLAAPSANEFGYISPTSAAHVLDSLGGKIPYILDGGHTDIGLESTIIGFDLEDNVIVHRVGGIAIEAIENIIGKPILWATNKDLAKPQTSGQLLSHYAPNTNLIIGDVQELHKQYQGQKLGLISLSNSYDNLDFDQRFLLSPSGNLAEAAQNLFSFLRQIDKFQLDLILVEALPNVGLGRAINDRLHRAQSIFKTNN
ncbi:MAG: threonylcarbamoyl-AMP synthase [Chitinophagaceae bacterium]|nr:threonylcarbamoyl-AMP synthase [Chitinophagaceae bacterium]